MMPTPTLHLRFIERKEHDGQTYGQASTRTARILQQFWEHPDGDEGAGDMFNPITGTWRDVPIARSV